MAMSLQEYILRKAGKVGGKSILTRLGKAGKHHKRVRRIVFSERQWNFVAQLINSVGRKGRVPRAPGGRYHGRRKRFF